MKFIKQLSLLLLLVPVSLFAQQQAYAVTPPDHNDGHAPLFRLDSKNRGIVIQEARRHCHKPANAVCHAPSLHNISEFLKSKQSTLEPPTEFNLLYKHVMPPPLSHETGANGHSHLAGSFTTVPIYLTTLRLRL